MRGARSLVAAAVLSGLACASPTEPPAPGLVSVEVFGALAPEIARPASPDAPVVVILDVTRSMLEPTATGAAHELAARRAAERFVRGLPPARPVWLYALGAGAQDGCQPVYRSARAAGGEDREPVLRDIASLPARGESSLPAALDGVRTELVRAGATRGSRAVVFSDLGAECVTDRDLCGAAARLAEAGVQLHVVAIGAKPAPACLSGAAGPAAENEAFVPPSPVGFRVIASVPDSAVVGCSETGGLPVAVPPGNGSVLVALDPPLRVEKIFVAGRRHVLQVLDFPDLDPPIRKWRWIDTPGGAR